MNNKDTLQKLFIFALFLLFFVLIIAMMYPYSTVFLWTALLYILLKPLYGKCSSRLNPEKKFYNGKQHFLAAGFSIGTLLLIVVPITIISIMLIQQCLTLLQRIENFFILNPDFIENSSIALKITELSDRFNIELPNFDFDMVQKQLISFIRNYSLKLFSIGKVVVTKTGSFLVSLVFVVFALYFCFIDGPYLLSLLKKAIPLSPDHMNIIIKKFSEIIKNLFSGYILVALYQGIAALIIMLCFKVEGALLLSVILMLASFIPLFGAAIVWAPIGIVICITRSVIKGILFLIISGICISFLDNFLRPLFLKDRINVHPLVIFFSILGGISFYGINGLILGPLIVILFFTVLDLIISTKEEPAE